MMRTVADFTPFVAFKSRLNAPENIHHAVRETIAAFMRESRAATNELFIEVPPHRRGELAELLLETPPCQRLVGVEQVSIPPRRCGTERWTPEWYVVPSVSQTQLSQFGYWVDDVGIPQSTLWLSDMVKTTTLHVRYSWAIGRDNCVVPDWIYEDYADVITDGALAYLHDIPEDEAASITFSNRKDLKFMLAAQTLRERARSKYAAHSLKLAHTWGSRG